MKRSFLVALVFCLLLLSGLVTAAGTQASANGQTSDHKAWDKFTLTFDGPQASETANTFTDYRLDVTFSKSGQSYTVPGYFAADGNAAETSATSGNKWRAHFTPPEAGTWTYTVSFKTGNNVATSGGGSSAGHMDGETGTVTFGEPTKSGKNFHAKGMLNYVEEHHLRFTNGEYFLKGGVDSPEDFLGYVDFDGTTTDGTGGSLHSYGGHTGDWKTGDPTWKNGKGKGIIGVINYISDVEGLNSMYFLTYNTDGGDGKNVWPWTGHNNHEVFDVSKLDQWEILFYHMMEKGVLMHVVLQETENDKAIAGGSTDHIKKLYMRELIARFGHHNALVWNMGEETTLSTSQIQAFANYIRETDPYNHPLVIHTVPGNDGVYDGLVGFSNFEGPSLQLHWYDAHEKTLKWIDKSKNTNKPWFVSVDEITFWACGVPPDGQVCRPVADFNNQNAQSNPDYDQNDVRKEALWGNLMAGGAGTEWYLGCCMKWNGQDIGDTKSENLRSHNAWWDQVRFSLDFFRQNTPFWEMSSCDSQLRNVNGYCLSKPGHVYVVYIHNKGDPDVHLEPGSYTVTWYDPKEGEQVGSSSTLTVSNAGYNKLGTSPAPNDAVALVTTGFTPPSYGLQPCLGCTPEIIVDDGELPMDPPPIPPPPGSPVDPNRLEPYIIPDGGTFSSPTTVTLSSRDGAVIHYTLDGSEPTLSSPKYVGPFTVSQTSTVRAKAFVLGDPVTTTQTETQTEGEHAVFGFVDDMAVMEAEHYAIQTQTEYTSWMTIEQGTNPTPEELAHAHFTNEAATASGNQYLMALPDRYENPGHGDPVNGYNCFTGNQGGFPLGSFECVGGGTAVLTYFVDFPAAGTYYIWIRGANAGPEANGIHAGINGEWPDSSKAMQFCGQGDWIWTDANRHGSSDHCSNHDKFFIDVPSAGVHEFHLGLREDGVYFDKIIISSQSHANGFRPPANTEVGPAETITSGTVSGGGGGGSSQPTHTILEESAVSSAFFTISSSTSGGFTDPSCFDGVRNGQETDVDCGGTCVAACNGFGISSFTLVDAITNQPMAGFPNPILPGSTVVLGDLSTRPLAFQANVAGQAKSVYFHVNSGFLHAENRHPWSMNGDFDTQDRRHNIDVFPWNPGFGTYTVTATPYTEVRGEGQQGRIGAIIVIFGGSGSPTVSGGSSGGSSSCSAGQQWDPATNTCFTPGSGGISGVPGTFTLVNADTNQVIPRYDPILDGATIDFADIGTSNVNVIAHIDAASVKFSINDEHHRTESFEPFTLEGDGVLGGSFDAWSPGPGTYTISVTPYSLLFGLGTPGDPESVTFTFVDTSGTASLAESKVESFTLVDAQTDQPIPGFDPVVDGAAVDLEEYPSISLLANVNTPTRSVQFTLNNQQYHLENAPPYLIASNVQGDYLPWEIDVGDHMVVATPYDDIDKQGPPGTKATLLLSVNRGGGTSPDGTTIIGGSGAGSIDSLTVYDSYTDKPLAVVPASADGSVTVKTSQLPISVVAKTSGVVGSVEFVVNNVFFSLENEPPFALASDVSGDFKDWEPQIGTYIVTAVPYAEVRAEGDQGTSKTLIVVVE